MSNNRKKQNSNTEKNLPDVFKELKESQERMKQIQKRELELKKLKEERKKRKFNIRDEINYLKEKIKNASENERYDYDFENITNNYGKKNKLARNRFNAIGLIIGIIFLICFVSVIKSNAIYAKTSDEVQIIGSYEKNSEPIDLMEIASNNLSDVSKKEIITERYVIEREYEFIPNTQLPKDSWSRWN